MAATVAERNAKMRERRRNEAISLLGGKCAVCGSVNDLQFDHIDSSTKSFTIGSNWTRRWSDILDELQKCQLLCYSCHAFKTIENRDDGSVEHGGGLGGKRRCPCEPCREKRRERMRELYHAQKPALPVAR